MWFTNGYVCASELDDTEIEVTSIIITSGCKITI